MWCRIVTDRATWKHKGNIILATEPRLLDLFSSVRRTRKEAYIYLYKGLLDNLHITYSLKY